MWTVLLIAFQLCFIDVNAQIDFSTLLALVGAQRSATGGVPVFGTDPRLRHDPLSYYRRNGRPAVADGVSLSNVNKVVHNTKYRTKERFQIWDLGQESAQLRSLDYKITTTTTLEPEVARAAPAPPPGSYGTSPYMGSWYPPPFPPYPPYGYPPYNPYLINPYANPNYGRRRGPRPKRPPTEESKVGEEKNSTSTGTSDNKTMGNSSSDSTETTTTLAEVLDSVKIGTANASGSNGTQNSPGEGTKSEVKVSSPGEGTKSEITQGSTDLLTITGGGTNSATVLTKGLEGQRIGKKGSGGGKGGGSDDTHSSVEKVDGRLKVPKNVDGETNSESDEAEEGDSEEDEDDERPKRISKCKKKYKKCKRRKSSDEESDSEENDDKEEEQEADNEEDDDGDSDGSEDEKDKKVDENEQTEGKMERTQNGG